jgi:hypothetical protein
MGFLHRESERVGWGGGGRTERETENIPAGYTRDHADPILRSYIIMVPILLHPLRVSKPYTWLTVFFNLHISPQPPYRNTSNNATSLNSPKKEILNSIKITTTGHNTECTLVPVSLPPSALVLFPIKATDDDDDDHHHHHDNDVLSWSWHLCVRL